MLAKAGLTAIEKQRTNLSTDEREGSRRKNRQNAKEAPRLALDADILDPGTRVMPESEADRTAE